MATYTLIPSSLTGGHDFRDVENAYTDTSSETYADGFVGGQSISQRKVYLSGFGSIVIPDSEILTDITIKVKFSAGNSPVTAKVWDMNDDSELSDGVTGDAVASVGTFTLTATISQILEIGDDLGIRFWYPSEANSWIHIYGAELVVTTVPIVPNKIIYGNETLIDLTSDTATASDVAVGKTFHLASGLQATGALSPLKATATTTGTSTRTVSFTSLTKQPSWFMMICADTTSTGRSYRVLHMLYDGTTTTTYYCRSNTVGSLLTSTTYGSFTYSSGTLTISVATTPYFGEAGWDLYYL